MRTNFDDVAVVLMDYFDALYFSDMERLARVFHPQAQYVSVTDGALLYRTMGEYFPIVENRQSPASRSELRRDSIVSIEFAGPVTALARLNCAIGQKFFTDLLTLIRVDGRWQIISKVFHFELKSS